MASSSLGHLPPGPAHSPEPFAATRLAARESLLSLLLSLPRPCGGRDFVANFGQALVDEFSLVSLESGELIFCQFVGTVGVLIEVFHLDFELAAGVDVAGILYHPSQALEVDDRDVVLIPAGRHPCPLDFDVAAGEVPGSPAVVELVIPRLAPEAGHLEAGGYASGGAQDESWVAKPSFLVNFVLLEAAVLVDY